MAQCAQWAITKMHCQLESLMALERFNCFRYSPTTSQVYTCVLHVETMLFVKNMGCVRVTTMEQIEIKNKCCFSKDTTEEWEHVTEIIKKQSSGINGFIYVNHM